MAAVQRLIAYIDGFNLYFGMRDSGLRRCYWLNVRALAENLLRANQQLIVAKYFTARIAGARRGDPPGRAAQLDAKRKRQSDYLEALATLSDFELFEGHYLGKDVRCRSCGATWRTHEEKMTDVQMATQMLADAFTDRFDTALLVSADSDLVPPARTIRKLFRPKRIIACFPPGRESVDLERAANATVRIKVEKLEASQFPDAVVKADGHVLRRPPGWR